MTDVPVTAIGTGEHWTDDLPLTCPTCGEDPLPIHHTSSPDSGLRLDFIQHCGHAWVRGIDTKEN